MTSPLTCRNLFIIKPTRCTNFSNLFLETPHVSDSSSVHHQEFFTVHTAMVCVIHVFCVYSEKLLMMYRGTVWNVEFYSKNKFEKISASSWFYYKNISWCTDTWMSNVTNCSVCHVQNHTLNQKTVAKLDILVNLNNKTKFLDKLDIMEYHSL